ncbi:T9SS type A sorting domain-containing protein [Mucilaginibacter mali]|uniref:T9SS type A sorting domain-containing protein n=1 Tax=Mucilaginibacter mali TaxID=2740462 RepID=A0A7D4Q8U6_9SPHI|nr:T9SS type A sorting domain-containing protein [Mucilaginibacter mali]QKJ30951.1 T9SS type A sorting domain-containing protein [Mucilaginibacter mali]
MKKRLLRFISPLILLIGFLSTASAQTATFANLDGGITPNSISNGQTQIVLYGFSATVSGGSITFNKFYVPCNNNTFSTYLTNATLFRSPTSTFSAAAPGTPIGNATITSSVVTIDNISETVSGTNYYFLVVDQLAGGYTQPYFNNTNPIAVDANGTTYNSGFSKYRDFNLNASTPYPLTVTPVLTTGGGLTASTTVITSGTNTLPLFEIAIKNNSSSSYTFSDLIFGSNQTNLGQFFNKFYLYVNTSNALPGSASANTTSSSGTVTFSGLSQTLAAGATKYYYLVADCSVTGSLPVNVQFNMLNNVTSIKSSSPSVANYDDFTVYGNTYNINYTNISVSSQQNGITNATLTAHQTDIVLFGFGVTSSGAVTLSGFNINSSGPASTYFSNAKLYRNGSGTYPNSPVQVGTVSFSGNFAVVTGLTETFTAGQTKYYFLVADNVGGGTSATIAFNFTSGQSSNAITQSAPAASTYNTYAITGNTFTIPSPAVYTVSANSPTANGISSGALYYGRKDIVVFGYGVEAYGAALTFNSSSIITSGGPSSYFSNIRVYRSTSPVFPGGTATYTSTNISDCNCGYYRFSGFTETVPANTTYYYFIVVDYTNSGGSAPKTLQFSFSTSQGNSDSQVLRSSPYTLYNPSSFSGPAFSVVNTEEWKGTVSGDLNNASNYVAKGSSSGGFIPTSTTIVRVGGVSYTNAPNINADLTIGGLAIENNATVALTATATLGSTLTLNNGLTIGTGATLNFSASGVSGNITLANGAVSYIETTGRLNLSGSNVTVDNSANTTGSFTLNSSASGTGSIGAITYPSVVKGTFVVERYFTGGALSNRGWRLMSSPVNNSGTNPLTTLNSGLTSSATYNFSSLKTNLLITGTGGSGAGFDQPSGYTANGATILFYTPTGASSGTFTSPSAPTSTAAVGSGFYFYFRGDNTTNKIYKVVKSGNYATPESNVVGLQSGTINQQAFTVNLINGYNLVGNPYPSTISLASLTLTGGATAFAYTYTSGGTSVTSTPIASALIASGQGFFIRSTNTGTVKFTEALKSTSQLTGSNLLLGTPSTTAEGNIKLQMVQDSANYDFAQLRYLDTYDKNYNETEDADDFNGSGQVVFFGAMTADNHLVAIASQPLDKKLTSVYLSVNDNSSGKFKINKVDLSNIPDKFDVFLMDHFKKDSIDLRKDSTYAFTMDKTNPATYGNARMEVVIRTKVLPPYQLLTFTGKRNSNNNVLSWTSKNEYTYTYFELQRSFDNKTFEGVNNAYSTGNGSYTFTDQSNQPLIYYRLKQTDINDNVTYSTVIILKSENSNIFSVYPNPTDNTLHFALNQDVKTSVTLRVYNSLGTLMKIKTYTSNSGDQDVSTLTPGSYMAELVDDYTKKLISSAKFIKL